MENIIALNRKVKLVDFGFACSTLNPITGQCGTLMFMAPELFPPGISDFENVQKVDGHAADMWACGVVFYALITNGHLPFHSRTERDMITRIKKGIYHAGNLSKLS